MASIKSRTEILQTALERFQESIALIQQSKATNLYTQVRDSVIQRFEFSFDIFWKCLKDYLSAKHGISVASPKSVLRESLTQKVLDIHDHKMFSQMIDDRNDTSHKYDESIAEEITKHAPAYYRTMKKIGEKISS